MIVAGNRDEFHARPTADADWWQDRPEILGGRDLEAGGTWLGVHTNGRFATVTNFRDADRPPPGLESRGHLITGFLETDSAPLEFVEQLDGERYAGFNLLAADGDTLAYRSNRGAGSRELPPGIYAVANASLDTPWVKVERSKAKLQALIDAGDVSEASLLELLADREPGNVDVFDTGGMPADRAAALSAPFVVMPEYGTRCSTVVLRDASGATRFIERRFLASGEESGESAFDV